VWIPSGPDQLKGSTPEGRTPSLLSTPLALAGSRENRCFMPPSGVRPALRVSHRHSLWYCLPLMTLAPSIRNGGSYLMTMRSRPRETWWYFHACFPLFWSIGIALKGCKLSLFRQSKSYQTTCVASLSSLRTLPILMCIECFLSMSDFVTKYIFSQLPLLIHLANNDSMTVIGTTTTNCVLSSCTKSKRVSSLSLYNVSY